VSRARRSVGVLLVLAVGALALPAFASAHAALLRTAPEASRTIDGAPGHVRLTYSETVEPKFAIVSVTDAAGTQQTTGAPRALRGNPATLEVPVRRGHKGWYLVYWRVISADGHPVRGAFTYAVGPNPGPAPQFVIPSLRETAATVPLLISRWVAFLSFMLGLGLVVFRLLVARPLARRVPEASLRPVSVAAFTALGVALVAVPVYVDVATAQFALRGALDLGAVVPLIRASAFGRGWIDMEILLALVTLAASIAVTIDRPRRSVRSVAEILATAGALAGIAAALLAPGLSGHAAEKSPRGLSLALDWAHLLAGSVWLGGLAGLIVLTTRLARPVRVRGLVAVVPRFSNVALASVLLLISSGTVQAFLRIPSVGTLYSTAYGRSLLVKIALLTIALGLASVNLLRSVPRLRGVAEGGGGCEAAAGLLRRLVMGEAGLLVAIVFAAGLLSSLPPPSSALANIGKIDARVGPGKVRRTFKRGPYTVQVGISPNRAAVPNRFDVVLTKDGRPVRGAEIVTKLDMLDMDMGQQAYRLPQASPSAPYSRAAPSLVMVGHWGVTFSITPPGAAPFDVFVEDKAEG
jgi:copper transport protein